jgi:hypothetical protein
MLMIGCEGESLYEEIVSCPLAHRPSRAGVLIPVASTEPTPRRADELEAAEIARQSDEFAVLDGEVGDPGNWR